MRSLKVNNGKHNRASNFSRESQNIALGRFAIIYFSMCSHLLNYQFAKNFWIKKVCRLLAHIDQRSPWAFIFIIIAFYFLWFWQNRVWDLSLSWDYQGMSGPNSDQERSSVRTGVRSSWCKHPEYRRWERDHAGGGGVSPMAERSFESPVTPQPPPRLLHIDHSLKYFRD